MSAKTMISRRIDRSVRRSQLAAKRPRRLSATELAMRHLRAVAQSDGPREALVSKTMLGQLVDHAKAHIAPEISERSISEAESIVERLAKLQKLTTLEVLDIARGIARSHGWPDLAKRITRCKREVPDVPIKGLFKEGA